MSLTHHLRPLVFPVVPTSPDGFPAFSIEQRNFITLNIPCRFNA